MMLDENRLAANYFIKIGKRSTHFAFISCSTQHKKDNLFFANSSFFHTWHRTTAVSSPRRDLKKFVHRKFDIFDGWTFSVVWHFTRWDIFVGNFSFNLILIDGANEHIKNSF